MQSELGQDNFYLSNLWLQPLNFATKMLQGELVKSNLLSEMEWFIFLTFVSSVLRNLDKLRRKKMSSTEMHLRYINMLSKCFTNSLYSSCFVERSHSPLISELRSTNYTNTTSPSQISSTSWPACQCPCQLRILRRCSTLLTRTKMENCLLKNLRSDNTIK